MINWANPILNRIRVVNHKYKSLAFKEKWAADFW